MMTISKNRRFLIAAAALVALAALGLPRARAAAEGPVTTLIADSGGAIRFQVTFDAPLWQDGGEDGGYRYPSWPAVTGRGEPGAPAIPMKVVRVAVPPGPVSLSYTAKERGRAGGVRFPPVADYVPVDPRTRLRDPQVRHTRTVEGPAYTSGGPLPQAVILGDGVERGLRVLDVGVRPVSWDPASGTAVWSSAVTVTVDVPSAAALPARPVADRVGQEDFGRNLVNPEAASRWQGTAAEVPPLPTPNGVPTTWFDDADGWAKIRIEANGIYKLDRSTLENMGVPVSTIDPRSFRLFAGPLVPHVAWADLGWDGDHAVWQHVYQRPEFSQGFGGGFDELPMLVRGNLDDGTMDGSDALLFYALGPDNYRERYGLAPDSTAEYLMNPFTSQTVYWLAWGGDFPDPPRRMAAVDAAPGAGEPVMGAGRTRLHFEKVNTGNGIYDPSMYDPGYRWQQWFWAAVSTDNPAGQGFELVLPHAVPGSTFDAWIRLWGAQKPLESGFGEEMLHHVHVMMDDADLGTLSWGGNYSGVNGWYTHRDVVADSLPVQTPDSLKLVVPQVGTNPLRYDKVYLTWVNVTYTRSFDTEAKAGEISVDAGASGRTVRVARPPSDPVVLDVTDPRHPVALTGVQVTGSGSGTAAEFAMADAGARLVALAPGGSLLAPAAGSYRDDPPTGENGGTAWLRDADAPLDYVIVAGDGFEGAGEILAQWRRDHLMGITGSRPARVRVVRVSDIMDEFNFGMWDPIAIRYFLEYAFRYYGPGQDRLSYCLFLGGHTRDPRDFGRSGVADIVPSWEDNRSDIYDIRYGNVQYASDDPLARFDGYETGSYDLFTDLNLGRIPARTATQARDIIQEKVVRVEQNPSYGPWRCRVVLVADDNCQGSDPDPVGPFRHAQQTEDVDAVIPAVFDRTKIYLYDYGEACIYASKPAAKRALLDAWDQGAWLVNYIGHGGNVVMADEHAFDVTDVPALTNDGRLPVLGAFSCSVGKFNNPDQEGIGEALILQPRTGTIVSAAATHLTRTDSNAALNAQFLRQLFPGGQTTPAVPIGVALMAAKRLAFQENDKYACLGDPASPLSAPTGRLTVTGPDTLKAGATPTYAVTRESGDGTAGTVDVLAEGPRLQRNRNDDGSLFAGWPQGYFLPGARLFSGRSPLAADTASVVFTVPRSIRDGNDAHLRVYASGDGWDSVGGLGRIPTDPRAGQAVDDTTGPAVSFNTPGTDLSPGDAMELVLEDPSGINLTKAFPVFSILLKVFDTGGLELLRQDLTDRFQYDEGSHTRGRVAFTVPDLVPGSYDFVVTAADNNGFTSRLSVSFQVVSATAGADLGDVLAYPNPFNPERESTQILFTLNRGAKITARVYSVAGRLVWKDEKTAAAGRGAFLWNGRDRGGDRVANGVYLVQLEARPTAGGAAARHLERVVVLR